MEQNLLEILLIIVYSCLALISIVIAVYAIGASYLGRETHRSKWRKKRRREELERKVKELALKADIEGINKEIERCNKEIGEIDDKLSFLNIWGAVIFPSAFFVIALITTVYNICADPIAVITYPIWGGQGQILLRDILETIAILFIVGGIYCLAKTLFAIEWAASRIPLPEFKVSFDDGQTSYKYKTGENVTTKIYVKNIGEDIAENVTVFILFSPKFNVQERPEYKVVLQGDTSKYPNYKAVIQEIDLIHMEIEFELIPIYVGMPKEADNYEIPVEVYERKRVGPSLHKLNLKVHS